MKLQKVDPLNAEIDTWAPKKSTAASPITVVDCFKGFDPATDTGDGVHMNAKGDKKVAACFFPALKAAIEGSEAAA
jgi:lysophospholipase L1-like esterase